MHTIEVYVYLLDDMFVLFFCRLVTYHMLCSVLCLYFLSDSLTIYTPTDISIALRLTCDPSRVYSASHPMIGVNGSTTPRKH